MNVIKGLTYQVYTTNAPSSALKMTVYEEGNPTGYVLASSLSNTGNPEIQMLTMYIYPSRHQFLPGKSYDKSSV